MWKKILIVRIATLNDKTNFSPPHNVHQLNNAKSSKAELKKTNLTPTHGVSFLADEPVQGGTKLFADTEVVEYSVYYGFAYSLAGQLQDAGDCILKGNCNCIVGHSHF